MGIAIRRLAPGDLDRFREIRLRALVAHPGAFGTTAEEEAAKPISQLAELLSVHAIFGGFDAATLVGIAAYRPYPNQKERHKATLWGMYVDPAARGQGLGAKLVDAVLEYARGKVIQVHLVVGAENEAARRLYESRGFTSYGLAPRALKVGDRLLDEHLMVCRLDG